MTTFWDTKKVLKSHGGLYNLLNRPQKMLSALFFVYTVGFITAFLDEEGLTSLIFAYY